MDDPETARVLGKAASFFIGYIVLAALLFVTFLVSRQNPAGQAKTQVRSGKQLKAGLLVLFIVYAVVYLAIHVLAGWRPW